MEKVLRKVSCKDRLPELYGDFDTNEGKLCFVRNKFYDQWNERQHPEYWYEEVDLDKIIVLEKQKYLLELSYAYQGTDMFDFLAKERYEKACNSSNKIIQYNHVSEYYYLLWCDVHKVLKIAAGLEE